MNAVRMRSPPRAALHVEVGGYEGILSDKVCSYVRVLTLASGRPKASPPVSSSASGENPCSATNISHHGLPHYRLSHRLSYSKLSHNTISYKLVSHKKGALR